MFIGLRDDTTSSGAVHRVHGRGPRLRTGHCRPVPVAGSRDAAGALTGRGAAIPTVVVGAGRCSATTVVCRRRTSCGPFCGRLSDSSWQRRRTHPPSRWSGWTNSSGYPVACEGSPAVASASAIALVVIKCIDSASVGLSQGLLLCAQSRGRRPAKISIRAAQRRNQRPNK